MLINLFKSEKHLFVISLLEVACLIIIVIFFAHVMWMQHLGHEKINKAYQLRYESYVLADQLRQSSDDLTRMIRSYISTGNDTYEEYFYEILDIRDGKSSRPLNYERVYWDFMMTSNPASPSIKGDAISLLSLMKESGFTKEEFQLLDDSKNKSDLLVRLEQIAMNAMKGKFLDDKNNFSIYGDPDPDMANQIVFGDEYHKAKIEIMSPINKFLKSIDERTSFNVNQTIISTNVYDQLLVFTLCVLLVNGILLIVTIKKQNSRKLDERKKAEELLQHNKSQLELVLESTEVGIWDWNIQNNTMVFNSRWAEIFGYSLEELLNVNIGEWWIENSHPDDYEKSLVLLEQHWRGDTNYNVSEHRMRHKDGHWVSH